MKLKDKIVLTKQFLRLIRPRMAVCKTLHVACPNCEQHIMYGYVENWLDLLEWEMDQNKKGTKEKK